MSLIVKAAVLHQVGGPFSVEEVELLPPESGEVRVRLAAAGICHSDWHFVVGDLDQINEAYAELLKGGVKRGVIVFDGATA